MKGRILVWVQFAAIITLLLLPDSNDLTFTRRIIGSSLILFALAILLMAFIALRESVTVYPEPRDNAPFITAGIYSIIRHPMYLAVLLAGIGIVIFKWSTPSIIVWLILLINLCVKFRYEDRLLAEKWPQALDYQSGVGAIFPKIKLWK